MVSERDAAKNAAKDPESKDPELGEALGNAHDFQIALVKEQNRHKESLAAGERGWFGRLFGGPNNAAVVIAFLTTLIGFAFAAGCLAMAASNFENSTFWSEQSAKGFAIATTALGFIFGRKTS